MDKLTREDPSGAESYPRSVEFIANKPLSRFALCNAVGERARELIAAWRGIPFQVLRNPVEVVIGEMLAGNLRIEGTAEEEPPRLPTNAAPAIFDAGDDAEEEEELKAA